MNKSAILAAMLILASSSAYAYENSYAGYNYIFHSASNCFT